MTSKKGLVDNVIQLLSNFYVSGLSFVSLLIIIRMLSPEQFALYNTFFSFPVVFGLLQTGLGISAIRKFKKDLDAFTSILVYSTILSTILVGIAIATSTLWLQYFPELNIYYTIPLAFIILGQFTVTDNILHAQKKFKEYAIIRVVSKTVVVAGIVITAILGDLLLLVIIESSLSLLITLFILISERNLIKWSKMQKSDFMELLAETPKSSVWFFSQFYLQVNVFLSSILLTSTAVSTLGALNIFAQPYMITAGALASTSIVQTKNNRYMSFILGSILLLGGTLVINIAPELWVELLTEGKYALTGYILPYTVGMVGIGLLHIFTAIRLNQDLLPWETITIATIHVGGLLLVNNLSGVVYMTLITGCLGFLVTGKYGVNYIRNNFKMI